MSTIKVVRAEAKDWPDIHDLLVNVAQWLKDQGSQQWNSLLRGEDSHQTKERLAAGQLYVGRNTQNMIVGMFILYSKQSDWDEKLWGKDSQQDYYYLHRLAVHRQYKNKGFGSDLMAAAKELTEKNGKKALRLDCRCQIEALNHFYTVESFKKVGQQENIFDGDRLNDFNLYEWHGTE